MKALIRQAVKIVPEARDFPPLPQILLRMPRIPDVRVPDVQLYCIWVMNNGIEL